MTAHFSKKGPLWDIDCSFLYLLRELPQFTSEGFAEFFLHLCGAWLIVFVAALKGFRASYTLLLTFLGCTVYCGLFVWRTWWRSCCCWFEVFNLTAGLCTELGVKESRAKYVTRRVWVSSWGEPSVWISRLGCSDFSPAFSHCPKTCVLGELASPTCEWDCLLVSKGWLCHKLVTCPECTLPFARRQLRHAVEALAAG